jgi:predicted nucleic acid-binding protein
MTYLLDVNALVALGYLQHEFHPRVAAWLNSHVASSRTLATSSITELGFVRVLAQTPFYGFTVTQARDLLLRLKAEPVLAFTFIADDQDISSLPSWAAKPVSLTDGHLAQLAKASGAILATLDRKIPGSFVIPE